MGASSPRQAFRIPENLVARCSLLFLWDEDYTVRVIEGYLQLMELKVNFEDWDADQLAPSSVIDMVWQQHLLYNKQYSNACKDFCGEVIGYDPDAILDHGSNEKRIETTMIALKALFGRGVDDEVWNFKASFAGPSGSSASVDAQKRKGRVTFDAEVEKSIYDDKKTTINQPYPQQIQTNNHNLNRHPGTGGDAPPGSSADSRDDGVSDGEASMQIKLAASGGSSQSETVNVKIKCFLDGKTQDTCIRVKRVTKMKKVEDCLAKLMNLESSDNIRFLVDGNPVEPWETLQSMKIDDPEQHWFTVMPKTQ